MQSVYLNGYVPPEYTRENLVAYTKFYFDKDKLRVLGWSSTTSKVEIGDDILDRTDPRNPIVVTLEMPSRREIRVLVQRKCADIFTAEEIIIPLVYSPSLGWLGEWTAYQRGNSSRRPLCEVYDELFTSTYNLIHNGIILP